MPKRILTQYICLTCLGFTLSVTDLSAKAVR